ncbi:MAG: hypothetical protein ACOC1I_08685, partial [Spirochaetota bacterium]
TGTVDPGGRVLKRADTTGPWSVEADALFVDYRAVAGHEGSLYVAGGSPDDGNPKTTESDSVSWRPSSTAAWQSYSAPSSLSKEGYRIHSLLAELSGVYMGTDKGLYELYMSEGTLSARKIAPTVTHSKLGEQPDPMADVFATGLLLANDLLIAAANYVDDSAYSGVVVWDRVSESWYTLGTETGLPSQNALDVAAAGTTLYVGTDAGLARAVVDPADIASASFETITLETTGEQPVITAVHVANDGVIYAASATGLWCSVDGESWSVIRRGSGLPDDGSLPTDEFVSVATIGDRVFAAMPGVGILELAWH